ncbi:MAG: hypothetical protein Q7R83_00195 [bacterium]|nr:hypothetical protein [bacterium]
MKDEAFGNRITDNALGADNGQKLIQSALSDIEQELGWQRENQSPLFSGVYYDSQKVGSYIVRVGNQKGETAVLKLQLKPLPYDEGSIIRHVGALCGGPRIRLPVIYADKPWESARGYGYVLFEDLSVLPDLWMHDLSDRQDRERHKNFLCLFFAEVLPMEAWSPKPTIDLKEKAKETFEHFHEIALKSDHHHSEEEEIQRMVKRYFFHLDQADPEDLHFTHGHLSGKDVKVNQKDGSFTLLANLYWSWRPKYHEIVFPIWVDLMHIQDKNLSFSTFLERVDNWCDIWREDIFDHDPTRRKSFWLRLLERSMLTVMLDLGASEWKEEERQEKQALLSCWQQFFYWIEENKL